MKRKTKIQINPAELSLSDYEVASYTVADVSDALSIEPAHNYCDDENSADFGSFDMEWN